MRVQLPVSSGEKKLEVDGERPERRWTTTKLADMYTPNDGVGSSSPIPSTWSGVTRTRIRK